jgi:hypothetical protein
MWRLGCGVTDSLGGLYQLCIITNKKIPVAFLAIKFDRKSAISHSVSAVPRSPVTIENCTKTSVFCRSAKIALYVNPRLFPESHVFAVMCGKLSAGKRIIDVTQSIIRVFM